MLSSICITKRRSGITGTALNATKHYTKEKQENFAIEVFIFVDGRQESLILTSGDLS